MVIPLVSCFLYGHSMESLSAINLYGQLMTLMFFFYGQTTIVIFFLKLFFRQKNFQFVIHIVLSNSKVLKTSKPKRNARQQFSDFHFPRFCLERKTCSLVLLCPILHHCRLYFSGMGFLKIFFFTARKGNYIAVANRKTKTTFANNFFL